MGYIKNHLQEGMFSLFLEDIQMRYLTKKL